MHFAIVNGQMIEADKAVLGIHDLSIVRGYGIFDFFKTMNCKPLFWEDNLDRFFHSAALMDLVSPYTRSEIKAQILSLIAQNNMPDSGIKLLLTGGYSPDGYSVAIPNLIITQEKITRNKQVETEGIKLISHPFHRAFPYAKTIDYVMGIQALKKAKSLGANDVVYVSDDKISECPRANIFFVLPDDTIVTPATNVLAGITRKYIIALAIENGWKVECRDVSLEDLQSAKEAFITSTTKNITAVNAIDDKIFGAKSGTNTEKLQALYEKLMQKNAI